MIASSFSGFVTEQPENAFEYVEPLNLCGRVRLNSLNILKSGPGHNIDNQLITIDNAPVDIKRKKAGWCYCSLTSCLHAAKIRRYRCSGQRVVDGWHQHCGDDRSSTADSRHRCRQTSSETYRQIVEEMFSFVVHCIQRCLLGRLHSIVQWSRRAQRHQLTTSVPASTSDIQRLTVTAPSLRVPSDAFWQWRKSGWNSGGT